MTEISPPTGLITIMYTDVEGSTALSVRLPTEYQKLIEAHRTRLDGIFKKHNGCLVDTAGDGCLVTFEYSTDALNCAVAIQESLSGEPIRASVNESPLKVRIGIYRAEREVRPTAEGKYIHREINRASRILCRGAKGEQILVDNRAWEAADNRDSFQWKAWEDRRLKDFTTPETLHELLWDGGESRGEPGSRFFPEWYQGERNRYIPRPRLENLIMEQFAGGTAERPIRLVTLHGAGGMGKTRLGVGSAVKCQSLFEEESTS